MNWIICVALISLISAQPVPPNCLQTFCPETSNKTNATCYKQLGNKQYYFFIAGDYYYSDPNDVNKYCPIYDKLFPNNTVNYKVKQLLPNSTYSSTCNYSIQCASHYCSSYQNCTSLGSRYSKCQINNDCALSFQCSGGYCVEGLPIGISCVTSADCDIITSLCYQNRCTSYFTLLAGSLVSPNQLYLCQDGIEISGVCVKRSTLPKLTYNKGKKFALCSSDNDCQYTPTKPTDLTPLCRCANDNALGNQGYCVYGGGEVEMVQAFALLKAVYYKKPLPVIRSLMNYASRDGHINFQNPAKCSMTYFLQKSSSSTLKVVTSIAALFLLMV